MLPLVPIARPQANVSRTYVRTYDDRTTYKPQLISSSVGLAQARPNYLAMVSVSSKFGADHDNEGSNHFYASLKQ